MSTPFSAAFPLATIHSFTAWADAVTPIADVERGTVVTIAGTIDRNTDTDEFRLTDQGGSIVVCIGLNWVPANVEETVTVHGFVDKDLVREVYARELVRADGSIIRFEHDYN